jgi:diguanylate cyclase
MEFAEKLEQAEAYAKAAISLMSQYQVPPHPGNFSIWYTYASGTFPDLKRAIEILISNGKDFDEKVLADLRQRFFGLENESRALQQATQRIEASLGQVIEYLTSAGRETNNYSNTLQNFSNKITDNYKAGDIRAMLGEVMSETKNIVETNRLLEIRLDSSTQEIQQLRENLDEVKREAMTDALTGIANRKLFDLMLRESATQSMETGDKLCLAMIDIDFFKKFNDTYGHQMGDQVLKLVARTLVNSIKGQDTAARYGGEEFAVVFPKTPLRAAFSAGENIRGNVASKQVTNKRTGETMGQITLSVGIAEYRLGEPLGHLIQRADEALYLAKHSGRNQVKSEDDLAKAELSLKA